MASNERSGGAPGSTQLGTANGSSETVSEQSDAAIEAKERDVTSSMIYARKEHQQEPANLTPSQPGNSSSQETRTVDSETSNSTQPNSNSSSPTTNPDTTLDFAKREVSGSQGQHSFSALSSMTKRSPRQKEQELDSGEGGEPVLQANDRERIRTPASAALRRTSAENDQIGRQEAFGDTHASSSSSQGSSVDRRGATVPGALSNPTSALPSEAPSMEASPKDALGFNFAPPQRRRHYEPARVVLHKSELQQGGANQNDGNNNKSSKNSSESELDPATIAAAVPSWAHSHGSPPASPDAAIRGSLKQLREPRQPIYIPAVLRPTDFESYKTTAGLSRIPAASHRPVTQHWVRDTQAHKCAACDRLFTWYRRRHHCRKCGSVFCAADAANTIGLDRGLNFSLLGVPCRACASCADDFAKYCLEAPRLRDGPAVTQPPAQGGEQEEVEAVGGGDWSTF